MWDMSTQVVYSATAIGHDVLLVPIGVVPQETQHGDDQSDGQHERAESVGK